MPSVTVSRQGATLVVTMASPESGNALGDDMVGELTAAFAAASVSDVRVIVLAGSPRVFCAGAHLGELASSAAADEATRGREAERLGRLFAAVLHAPQVTIAAVRGAAYGGGAGLAAACDFVVASPAARFQFSEVRLGFVPALVSVFVARRVGLNRLAALFLDPMPVAGEAALAIGLVDELAADPDAAALARAERVAATSAPAAVAATKRLLLAQALPDLDARLAEAAAINAAQRAHPECREGVAHFLAHRSFPDWSRHALAGANGQARLDTSRDSD